jgi:hypothetical protein
MPAAIGPGKRPAPSGEWPGKRLWGKRLRAVAACAAAAAALNALLIVPAVSCSGVSFFLRLLPESEPLDEP